MRTLYAQTSGLLREFIVCHQGRMNQALHVVGFAFIAMSLMEKSVTFLILGSLIQESGHFYQYWKTHRTEFSPWACFRPQSVFAYPLFFVALAYILLSR